MKIRKPPKGMKVIQILELFTMKTGFITKGVIRKVRNVRTGDLEQNTKHDVEVYASVVCIDAVRLMIAVATHLCC